MTTAILRRQHLAKLHLFKLEIVKLFKPDLNLTRDFKVVPPVCQRCLNECKEIVKRNPKKN
jgi:hypothetical protein